MQHSIYHNAKTDRQYRAATGLSAVEFEVLFRYFAAFYAPKSSAALSVRKEPVLTDKREALFFILFAYKACPTLQNLGFCFGISDAAASRYLESLKPCLKAALQQQSPALRRVFSSQSDFDTAFSGVTDIFLDVTEVPIERADNYTVQKEQYSGKKIPHPEMVTHLRCPKADFVRQPIVSRSGTRF